MLNRAVGIAPYNGLMAYTGTVRATARNGTAAIQMDDGEWCSAEFPGADAQPGDQISDLVHHGHGSQRVRNLTQGSQDTVYVQGWGSARAIWNILPDDAKISMARFIR